MSERPINGLMSTAMNSIKEMIDVNTIIGDAVETPDGSVIIPVSKVSFGFVSGGGEYTGNDVKSRTAQDEEVLPFAGGSGAGVTISPVAFMIAGNDTVRMLPVGMNSALDKFMDILPQFLDKKDKKPHRKLKLKKILSNDNDNDEDEE